MPAARNGSGEPRRKASHTPLPVAPNPTVMATNSTPGERKWRLAKRKRLPYQYTRRRHQFNVRTERPPKCTAMTTGS